MLLKYYSNWVSLIFFFIWLPGYLLNIKEITNNIHPNYALIVTSIGYTMIMIYYIYYRKDKFELSFLVFVSLAHYVPLYISYKYSKKLYVKEFLLITVILYGIYMIYINKNPIDVYFNDKVPHTWEQFYKRCRLNSDKFSPICNILKLIKDI